MPLYDFRCDNCGRPAECFTKYAELYETRIPCRAEVFGYDENNEQVGDEPVGKCAGSLAYEGISFAPAIGSSHQFGVILDNGRKVAGTIESVKR